MAFPKIALAIAGMGLQAIGGIASARATQRIASVNAALAQQEGEQAAALSKVRAESIRRDALRRSGALKAGAADSGVLLSGSVLDVLADQALEDELNARLALFEGESKRVSKANEAAITIATGRARARAKLFEAAGSIALGASRLKTASSVKP